MPDNPITNRRSFVDYSYYVLIGVKSMEYASNKGHLILGFDLLAKDVSHTMEYIIIGGYKSIGSEVKIECREIHYYTFDDSKTSTEPNDFIPYETPNFKQTLNTDEVEGFFSFQNIPPEIKAVLGDNINSVVWK